jgi:hypothetical protein
MTMAFLVAMLALPIASSVPARGRAFAAEADAKAPARERFQKGVAAYADQRFAEAAKEFEAAYRLSGGAVSIGGIVLVATAPGNANNNVSLASWVTTGSGGVVMRGAW